ncbi:ATP-binding protein [Chloroflexota bacterium]
MEVQDNGPGVSDKDQKYLFQPYKRLRRHKGQHGGLGLGLAICKKMREVSVILGLSIKTIENYRTHILNKLDLNRTVDLVAMAHRYKLI